MISQNEISISIVYPQITIMKKSLFYQNQIAVFSEVFMRPEMDLDSDSMTFYTANIGEGLFLFLAEPE